MSTPKFHNKDNTLTGYSFACGYVEKYGIKDEEFPRATISREPNGYHIKGFDKNGVHFWEIEPKVKDARAYARKKAGRITRFKLTKT